MHEMGIALDIVEIASSAIPSELSDVQVEVVNLKVGKLTAVVPESLRFCFNLASRDTPLAGARLCMEEVPVVARCDDCGVESTIDEPPFFCRVCGSGGLDIITGRELMITSIEIADPSEEPSTED